LDRRKKAKLQWLLNPSQINRIQTIAGCEISRNFTTKKKSPKDQINVFETNKNKIIKDLYRGSSKSEKGYQTMIHFIKDENGDLLANYHDILNIWKNYFCQLLYLHWINKVAIHTA
jgi:hypothetical protein